MSNHVECASTLNFGSLWAMSVASPVPALAFTTNQATNLWLLARGLIIKVRCHCHAQLSAFDIAAELDTLMAKPTISFHIPAKADIDKHTHTHIHRDFATLWPSNWCNKCLGHVLLEFISGKIVSRDSTVNSPSPRCLSIVGLGSAPALTLVLALAHPPHAHTGT